MNQTLWARRESRWRLACYLAWTAPLGWCLMLGLLSLHSGIKPWMLEAALVPVWVFMATHLAYYVVAVRRRFALPGWLLISFALVPGLSAWGGAGWVAGLTAALGVPLLVYAGIAQQLPVGTLATASRRVVLATTILRPLALIALALTGWVLVMTEGGRGLPPGHMALWTGVAVFALVVSLIPSAAFLRVTRRQQPSTDTTAPPGTRHI